MISRGEQPRDTEGRILGVYLKNQKWKKNKTKEFRRVETRYDKRDDSFFAFVLIATTCISFSNLHI